MPILQGGKIVSLKEVIGREKKFSLGSSFPPPEPALFALTSHQKENQRLLRLEIIWMQIVGPQVAIVSLERQSEPNKAILALKGKTLVNNNGD